MRVVFVAVLWAVKLTSAAAAVAALGLASPKIAELGHALAGSTYDAYLAWLARGLEAPMKILAPVFRADEGNQRYIWEGDNPAEYCTVDLGRAKSGASGWEIGGKKE